jgi:hypothetical protein
MTVFNFVELFDPVFKIWLITVIKDVSAWCYSPVNLTNIQLNLKKIATEIILTFLRTVAPLETNMKNRLWAEYGKTAILG